MKDSLMQKVQPVSLCLNYSTNSTSEESVQVAENLMFSNEKDERICRSVATIGFAIAIGATGMLLFGHERAAVAVESPPLEAKVTSLPRPILAASKLSQPRAIAKPAPLSYVKLAPLAVKHQVKPGESLWKLAKEYQIAPAAIAASNKISPQADLSVGQTLKIPAIKESDNSASKRPTPKIADNSLGDEPEQLNSSLKNLRETRKRLQTSLAQLKFKETEITSGSDFTTAPSQLTLGEQANRLLASEKNPIVVPQNTLFSPEIKSEVPSDPLPVPLSAIVNPRSPKPQQTEEVQPKNDSLANPVLPTETATAPYSELKEPELVFPEVNAPLTNIAEPTAKQAYQVKQGDTLNLIAKKNSVSVAALIRANKITNPNLIKVAQQLIIPQSESAQQAETDSSLHHKIPESSLPVVTASLAPIAPETARPQKTAKQSDEAIEISEQESATLAHTEKLMADIERLQQEYSNEQPKTDESDRTKPKTINREWVGNRQFNAEQAPISIPNNRQNSRSKTQLVGAAPSGTGQYNDIMRVPVGETVGPELPPLSSPDDYLPDTPMKFTGYIWPARGVLTSGYGWRWGRMHKGVDIAAPIGTPIMAAAPGEVVSAGWNSGGYGNLVKVKHTDGSLTLYAHNNRVLVRTGQMVEQGEQIAEMGSTGFSTGPHLHFEIHPNGQKAVNPMAYLPKERS